jgi:DNA polymerase III subunit epsilon
MKENKELIQEMTSQIWEFIKFIKPPSNSMTFFDTETTGLEVNSDRIVSITAVKVNADEGNGAYTFIDSLINPRMPIPEASTKIHGITDDMVKDSPVLKDFMNMHKEVFENTTLCGYNSNRYDVPLLLRELHLSHVDINLDSTLFMDVQDIYRRVFSGKLSMVYKRLLGEEMESMHNSLADTHATVMVAGKLLEHGIENVKLIEYDNLSSKIIKKDGIYYYNFGKHIGIPVTAELSYAEWMITKGDFDIITCKIIRKILNDYK